MHIEGRARVLGDDINTDYIIASTRKRDTLDAHLLKRYLLETVDPAFAASIRPGDLLVAGSNFGCGSAMEIAATVILAAGITAVLARSFSRTFFRNAINNGLLPVECDTSEIGEGDQLRITVTNGTLALENQTRGTHFGGTPIPELMTKILTAGGLVPYMRSGGWSERVAPRDTD
jgi:3-isopropylmalate/(R)-2-methylmalate dehydratase small subunit